MNLYAREIFASSGFIEINSPKDALPYILNISFGKIRSEIMLNALSEEGIYVSSGSACASGKIGSHVLDAMNAPLPDSAIRFSLSRYNTRSDIDALCSSISAGLEKLVRIKR